ncbi:hypothetical protein BN59_00607 [Legionella massiliensis]|uniref:Uncharacterized protein n=1 Tax=Legionella massiliensis TaxID=1034943 RepID=A0A078KPK4_9GAMM|nr:hypothetical protein [Legionella massiliensis]CDZ76340.1 hypothetical protein BN59_00607 [Legionella massiliensis]CEE12078.1 hypothetical protein BN1094_00607 [Legionella massiliensis]
MSVVLQGLQPLIGEPFIREDGNEATWELSGKLALKEDAFYEPMVTDHPILNMRYSVLCARLAHNLALIDKEADYEEQKAEELTQQLADALALAEILAFIYGYYLYVPREVKRLLDEQEAFRDLLKMRGYVFPEASKKPTLDEKQAVSFTESLKTHHRELNWPRLFSVRLRRIFVVLQPYFQDLKRYGEVFGMVDQFIAPVLNHLAYLFFIPRLAVNTFLLFKHLIPGWWLSAEEKKLSWLTRLQAQLQRRWFEMLNDTAWMIGGLLNCYVLIGALAPVGMYVSISLFFFDVILAGVKAFIELGRLNTLRNEYKDALNGEGLDPDARKEIEDYQVYLEQRFISERRQLLLSVVSTSALFLAMCFAIPALAGTPALPLVGAVLVLIITLATYLVGEWLKSIKPSYDLKGIKEDGTALFAKSPHNFFHHPRNTQDSDESAELSDVIPRPIHISKSSPNFSLQTGTSSEIPGYL